MAHAVPYAQIFLGIAVVIVASRLMGVLFRRIRQPVVVGEIVAGLLLGASALAHLPGHPTTHLFPLDSRPFLNVIAALGLVLFMFIVGLELDLSVIRGQERLAISVSLASIALPFGGGVLLGLALYSSHMPVAAQGKAPFALFIGAAMSITAFPVLARILADRGMLRTPLGGAAIASAAVDDVAAWSLLAIVVAIAGPGTDGASEAQWHLWLTLPYLLVMVVAVRPLLMVIVRRYQRAERLTPDLLAVVLVGVLLSAYVTDWLGIHYIFGAFLFGAVMPRAGAAQMFQEILERLEQVSVLLLLPVFFVVTGLAVDFWHMGPHWVWQLPAILGVAIAGKFLGAFGASRLQGVPRPRSAAIGVLMNTRGLTEIVILTVGAQKGILDRELFSMLVFMAVFTTLMTGPLLRVVYSDRRLARDVAEAERAALGAVNAYRVLVVVPAGQADPAVVDVSRQLLAGEHPAELVLAQVRPLATPVLEVGSGLSIELGELTVAAEQLERLRGGLEARGVAAVTIVRMSADPGAEIAAMAASVEADVVVIEEDSALRGELSGRLSCQLLTVDLGNARPGDIDGGAVRLLVGGSTDADAAAEVAVRLAVGRAGAVVVQGAATGDRHGAGRRVSAFVTSLQKAGLDAVADEERDDGVLVVAADAPAIDTRGAVVRVSAEQDRDVLAPERLVRGVLAKVAVAG